MSLLHGRKTHQQRHRLPFKVSPLTSFAPSLLVPLRPARRPSSPTPPTTAPALKQQPSSPTPTPTSPQLRFQHGRPGLEQSRHPREEHAHLPKARIRPGQQRRAQVYVRACPCSSLTFGPPCFLLPYILPVADMPSCLSSPPFFYTQPPQLPRAPTRRPLEIRPWPS